MKAKKRMRGAIAVFLCCIMLGMTVFECLLIDSSRIVAAKTAVSGAGDLALNSALTNYDKVLNEVYGLFANSADEADLEKNLTEYFNETLQGAGIDATADDVGNLLGLLLEENSLSIAGVNGSALSEPDVLEQQILEYMKFRGPVNIGLGLIEKIKAFGDYNKQTEAMEAQLEFEEQLDSLQDVCQKVYDRANELRTYDESYPIGTYWNDIMSTNIGQNITKFEEAVMGFVRLKWYVTNADNETIDITDAPSVLNEQEDPVWNSDEDYEKYFDIALLTEIMVHPPGINHEYILIYNGLVSKCDAMYYASQSGDLPQLRQTVTDYCAYVSNNIEELQSFFSLLSHYETWYNRIGMKKDEENTSTENADFYSTYHDAITIYRDQMKEACVNVQLVKYQSEYESQMQSIYEEIHNSILYLKSSAESGENKAKGLRIALVCESHNGWCCMKNAVDKTQKAKETWQSRINALPDGNAKTSMQGTFESEASGISHEQYQKLLEIAQNIENFFKYYQEYLDQYQIQDQAGGYKAIVDTGKAGIDWIRLYSLAEQYYNNHSSAASFDCIDTTIQTAPVNPYPSRRLGGENGVIDKDEFYQYLAEVCGQKAEAPESDKKVAEDSKKTLLDKGNESDGKSADRELAEGVDWAALEAATENGGHSDTVDTDIKNVNKKDISKSAKKAMKSSSGFLDGIGNILVTARDKIYLAEYATGMFSCYTSGIKDNQETNETLFTIAGNDPDYHMLTKEHNILFQSEQEYILWGDQNQKKNVNNTLGAIFGIRLVLNMVYAFTGDVEINATTLAWATAIAGWTGFGVPLVQSVLKVAFALAESAYDILLIKKGYDIAFYKTSLTWMMKPSNITSGVIELAEGEAEDTAKKAIGGAFDYVDNLAGHTIQKVGGSVAKTVEDTKNSMIDTAVATILSPFEKKIVTLSTQIGQTAEGINTEVNHMYDNIMNGIDTSNTLGKLEYELMQNNRNVIVDYVTGKVNELKGQAQKSLDAVSINNIAETLKKKADLSSYVTQLGEELTQQVDQALNNMEANVEEAVTDGISDFFDGIHGTGGSSGTVTRGAAFTMNYQEYLHIFLILKCATNSDQYLTRMGHLIQLNMSKRDSSFALNKSYTLFQLNAKVKVNTTFIGKLDSFLEHPVNGPSQYTLTYRGLSGY